MSSSVFAQFLIPFFVGAFFVAAVIYVTPLKWVTVLEPTVTDISAEDFYDKYVGNEDKYIFIDVRGVDAYNRIHAEGAESMPLHTLYDERINLPKNVKDKEVVLICSGGRASGVGYSYLQHYGFFNIVRIEGGIEAWQLAGLPVVTGL
jgi:rhodanese-related sulfurtransferase